MAAPRCSPKHSTSRSGMAYRRRAAPTTSLGLISTGGRGPPKVQQWSLFLASPFGENKLLCVRPQCLGGCHECAPALLLGDAIRRLAFYYLAAPRMPATGWASGLPKTGRSESHRAVVAGGAPVSGPHMIMRHVWTNLAARKMIEHQLLLQISYAMMLDKTMSKSARFNRGNLAGLLLSASVFLILRYCLGKPKSWTNCLFACCLSRRHDET